MKKEKACLSQLFTVVNIMMAVLFFIMVILLEMPTIGYSESEFEIISMEHEMYENEMSMCIKVKNNTNYVYKDLNFEGKLYCIINQHSSNLMDVQVGKFEIGKGDENITEIKFSFSELEKLPKGDYYVFIDVTNHSSMNLAHKSIKIEEVGGTNEYLFYYPNSVKFIINNREVNPYSGPNYEKNISPKLIATYKNQFHQSVNLRPYVTIYQRSQSFNPEPVFTGYLEEEYFESREERVVELDIPSNETPESYYVQIEFVNFEGEVVSGIIECRYVVKGESAKIISHKSFIQDGLFHMNAEVIGPADGGSIQNVLVRVRVFDKEKSELLMEMEETIHIDSVLREVNFTQLLNYSATEFLIEYQVEAKEKVLDCVEVNLKADEITLENRFIDISDYKFKKSIIELALLGIVNGYEDQTFRPENKITRAEFSVIMCYLLGKEEEAKLVSIGNEFEDMNDKHWAAGFVKVLKDEGYIKGYVDNTFKPSNLITYAEAITVIVNIIAKEEIAPTEVWYEGYVHYAQEHHILSSIDVIPNEYIVRGEVAEITYKAYELK